MKNKRVNQNWNKDDFKSSKKLREFQPDGVNERGRQSWTPNRSVGQRWAPTTARDFFVKVDGEEE